MIIIKSKGQGSQRANDSMDNSSDNNATVVVESACDNKIDNINKGNNYQDSNKSTVVAIDCNSNNGNENKATTNTKDNEYDKDNNIAQDNYSTNNKDNKDDNCNSVDCAEIAGVDIVGQRLVETSAIALDNIQQDAVCNNTTIVVDDNSCNSNNGNENKATANTKDNEYDKDNNNCTVVVDNIEQDNKAHAKQDKADEFVDDGRVIFDMSMLDKVRRQKSKKSNKIDEDNDDSVLTKAERRAIIKAGLAVYLPRVAILALGFVLAMLLIKWWLS